LKKGASDEKDGFVFYYFGDFAYWFVGFAFVFSGNKAFFQHCVE